MMERRTFVGSLALGTLAVPRTTRVQPVRKVHRIGILGSATTSELVRLQVDVIVATGGRWRVSYPSRCPLASLTLTRQGGVMFPDRSRMQRSLAAACGR